MKKPLGRMGSTNGTMDHKYLIPRRGSSIRYEIQVFYNVSGEDHLMIYREVADLDT